MRFAVILFLWAGSFLWPRNDRLGPVPKIGLYGAIPWFIVGVLSSILCEAPLLGLIKICLYAGLMIPLFFSQWTANCFRHAERIGPLGFGLFLLVVAAPFIFRNPNQVGLAALFALPFILNIKGLRRPHIRSREKLHVFRLGGIALIFLILVISASRGSLVGGTAAILSYMAIRRSPNLRSILGKLTVIISSGLFISFFAGFEQNRTVRDFAYKNDVAGRINETLIDDTRLLMFDDSIESFLKRPIFGYGFGLSENVRVEDQKQVFQTGRLSQIVGEFGNSTIAILCGGGIALLLMLCGLIGIVIINGINKLLILPIGHPFRQMFSASVSGVIGLGVQAQAEGWMLSFTWPTFVFWMLLGNLNNYCGNSLSRDVPGRIRRSQLPRRVTKNLRTSFGR